MSDSVWPHKRQPTRLPHPWDSPGKNTGGVPISFSNAWKWKVKVKLLSRVRLFSTPWTAALQAPPSMGFSRQEYWSGMPSPSLEDDYIIELILVEESLNWATSRNNRAWNIIGTQEIFVEWILGCEYLYLCNFVPLLFPSQWLTQRYSVNVVKWIMNKIMAFDSILKSRDITLSTKVRLVKAMVFPVVI